MERQAGQPHISPWGGDGAANPANHFQAHEGHEDHEESSAWFTRGMSCLTKLINFSDEMTGLADKRRAVDTVYPISVRLLTLSLTRSL